MFVVNTNNRLVDVVTELYNYVLAKTKDKRQFNAPLIFAVKPICSDNSEDYSIARETYSEEPVFRDGYFSLPLYIVRGFDIDLSDYRYNSSDTLDEIIYSQDADDIKHGKLDSILQRKATTVRTLRHILSMELEKRYGTKILENTILKPTFKGLQVIFKDEDTVNTILQNPTPLYNIIYELGRLFNIKRVDYLAGDMYMLTYADDIVVEMYKYIGTLKRHLSIGELSSKMQLDVLYTLIDPKFKIYDRLIFNEMVESSEELDNEILQRYAKGDINKEMILHYPSVHVDVKYRKNHYSNNYIVEISSCLSSISLAYNSKYIAKPSSCRKSNQSTVYVDIKPY